MAMGIVDDDAFDKEIGIRISNRNEDDRANNGRHNNERQARIAPPTSNATTSIHPDSTSNVSPSIDSNSEVLAKHLQLKIGRGAGNPNIPHEMRAIIAQTKLEGGSIASVANAFGVSPDTVNAYAHDATSERTYHKADPKLKESNDKVREVITSKSRQKLLLALDHITEENLSGAKARDLAGIAKDMSAVINNISPSAPATSNAQFIFFHTEAKHESDYDIIDVSS